MPRPTADTPTETLAHAVLKRRRTLGLSQAKASKAAELSVITLRAVEQGTQPAPRPLTMSGIDRLMGWPDGTTGQVLAGNPAPPAGPSSPGPNTDHLTERLDQLETDQREILIRLNEILMRLDACYGLLRAIGSRP